MKFRTLLPLLVCAASGMQAAQTEFQIGSTAAPWLKLPKSARSAGMADAFSSVADSVDSLGVNPAGLANFSDHQLSISDNLWVQDMSTYRLAYGQPLSFGGMGISLDYIGYGTIDLYDDASGAPVNVGTSSPVGMDLNLGYAHRLGDLMLGGSLKYISQDLGGGSASESTAAVDLGVLWKSDPVGASFGLAVQNLGGQLGGYNLPVNFQLGAAFLFDLSSSALRSKVQAAPGDTFQMAVDLNLPMADTGASSVQFGAEYWFQGILAGRAGYRLASAAGPGGLSGFSAGAGFRLYQRIQVDYAYVSLGELGSGNLISLQLGFGGPDTPVASAATTASTETEAGKPAPSLPVAEELPELSFEFQANSKVPGSGNKIYVPTAFEIRSNISQEKMLWKLEVIAPDGTVFRSLKGDVKQLSMAEWDGKSTSGLDFYSNYDYEFRLSLTDSNDKTLWQGNPVKRRCVFRR